MKFAGVFFAGLLVWAGLFSQSWERPLQGLHSHRQADTLFVAFSYCLEPGAEFLKPRILHRGDTPGVAVGEFPLFSWLVSLPCQVSGEWSETWAKTVTLGIYFLAALAWTFWWRRRLREMGVEASPWVGMTIFSFMALYMGNLSIPLPDALAALLVALSGWFAPSLARPAAAALDFLPSTATTTSDSSKEIRSFSSSWRQLAISWSLSFLLFGLAFLVRPYVIFLLPLVHRGWRPFWINLGVCVVAYFVWFKWWAVQQSDVLYYNTTISGLAKTLGDFLPSLGASLEQLFIEHWNVVGIYWVVLGARRFPALGAVWLLSLLGVLLLRGSHIHNHHYYLLAASLVGFVLLWVGFSLVKPKWQFVGLVLYVLVGFVHNQHLWRGTPPERDEWRLIQAQMQSMQVPPNAKLSVSWEDPIPLYFAKRTGTLMGASGPPTGACALGTSHYLFYDESRLPVLRLCTNWNSDTLSK